MSTYKHASQTSPSRDVSAQTGVRSSEQPREPLALEFADEPDANDDFADAAPTRVIRTSEMVAPQTGAATSEVRLVIISGNNIGREFALLKEGELKLGRGIDCDIVLADLAVSRNHAVIAAQGTAWTIHDVGSGNGIIVNGKPSKTASIQIGDQIELGNTILRLIQTGSNTAPAVNTELASGSASKSRFAALPPLPSTEQNLRATVALQRSASRLRTDALRPITEDPFWKRSFKSLKRQRRYSLLLLVVGGFILLGSIGIGLKVRSVKKKEAQRILALQQQREQEEKIQQEFKMGIAQFNAHNWIQAKHHFSKVLAIGPDQTHVKRFIEQASIENQAKQAFDQARERFAASEFFQARKLINQIQGDSVYYNDAMLLLEKINAEEVAALLQSAERLEGEGDLEGALEQLKKALTTSPTNSGIRELHDELEKRITNDTPTKPKRTRNLFKVLAQKAKPSNTPPSTVATSEPQSPFAKAMALYKKREWGAAFRAMQTYADKANGEARASAVSLGEAIRRVEMNINQAEKTNDKQESITFYQKAMHDDRLVENGYHQAYLKGRIGDLALERGKTALHNKNYGEVRRLLELITGSSKQTEVETLRSALLRQAEALLAEGNALRENHPARARELYKQILTLLPAAHPLYQKAEEKLKATHQQEDAPLKKGNQDSYENYE